MTMDNPVATSSMSPPSPRPSDFNIRTSARQRKSRRPEMVDAADEGEEVGADLDVDPSLVSSPDISKKRGRPRKLTENEQTPDEVRSLARL